MIGIDNEQCPQMPMSKEEAIKIVVEELQDRLPKSNKEGFLPPLKVYQAMALLSEEKE